MRPRATVPRLIALPLLASFLLTPLGGPGEATALAPAAEPPAAEPRGDTRSADQANTLPVPLPEEQASRLAPVSGADRYALAVLADTLPAHGVPPLAIPAMDAEDKAWVALARRLIRIFAPRTERRGDALDERLSLRPLAPEVLGLVPVHRRYRGLMVALERLRSTIAAGQPALPRTTYRVAVGVTAPEVALLRSRLLMEGYGDPAVTGRRASYFDGRLKRAMWAWQKDHGLPVTIWLDDLTRTRLNAPLDRTVARLMLALSRWRELGLREDAETQVIVHINALELVAERGGLPQLTMPVSVGRPDEDNATQPRSTTITKVIAHPSWRVPARIVSEELRPKVDDDPEALRGLGYTVELRSGDRWRVTMPPGPTNPLGRLKLTLHATGGIYLHDTPDKGQFKRSARLLSHGCVRLSAAVALGQWALDEQQRETLSEALGSGKTRAIRPEVPVPTHLSYQTISADPEGHLTRHPDLYDRDTNELKKLRPDRLLASGPAPRRQPPEPAPSTTTDERAPYALRLAAQDLEGQPAPLQRHAGKLLILSFVADWCAVCHTLAPQVVALAREVGGDAVVLEGVDADRPTDEAVAPDDPRPTVGGYPFPLLRVPAHVMRGSSALGPVSVLPTTWIIGRSGVPLYRYEGGGEAIVAAMREDLSRYLHAERRLGGDGAPGP